MTPLDFGRSHGRIGRLKDVAVQWKEWRVTHLVVDRGLT
jgi:sporulation protein YlmC with PRC-barrel domain